MSSNESPKDPVSRLSDLFAKPGEALVEIARRLPGPLAFGLGVAILYAILVAVDLTVPDDTISAEVTVFFYVLLGLVLVAYVLLKFMERTQADEKVAPSEKKEPPEEGPKPKDPVPTVEPPLPQNKQRTTTSLDPTAALHAYLRRLQTVCNTLNLQYIDPKSFESEIVRQKVMTLSQVYTTLDTTTRVIPLEPVEEAVPDSPVRRMAERMQREGIELPSGERTALERALGGEPRPVTTLEAAGGQPLMVLLGDPGSGKSTFVKYLTLCLSGEILFSGQGWIDRLQPEWTHGPVLPVLVVLRDFARSEHCDGSADGLWRYIASDVGDLSPDLERRLKAGEGVLLLLDGLDEVSDERQRIKVRDAVARFSERYSHSRNRYLVTCRVYAYAQEDDAGTPLFQLPERFAVYTLAPFDGDRMDAFIDSWYGEVQALGWKTADEADALAGKLKEAARHPGLEAISPRPLLLTVMALLHTTHGSLPDDRVELYDETIKLLLARWQEARLGTENGITCQVNLEKLRAALERVTYEAHRSQPTAEGTVDILEKDLREALAEGCLQGNWNQAGEMIKYIQERAGLLFERAPKLYAYPHRTFQEYMAASYLCIQPAYPQESAGLLRKNQAQWQEVYMMAASIVSRIKRMSYIALYAVDALCPRGQPPTDVEGRSSIPEQDWRDTWLAGEAILEVGLDEARQANPEVVNRVRTWLVALVEAGALAPVERAAAGRVLSRLGDPRFREEMWFLPVDAMLGFVEVPAGPFTMGNDPGEPDADGYAVPRHEVTLDRYYIARYPVTTAQFSSFVQESGHQVSDRWQRSSVELNHPTVAMDWHDARAYCAWLTERLKESGDTPEALRSLLCDQGWQVRLPSEAEWEKAARGTDGRFYPWGNEFDPQCANHEESGIGGPSTVGCFPAGRSPYGCLDMAGNVWEWTRSLWGEDLSEPAFKYPYVPGSECENENADDGVHRVLRGGAYLEGSRSLRCAYRLRDLPIFFLWLGYVGFRVVVAPGLPSGR